MENILDILYEYSKRRQIFDVVTACIILKKLLMINGLDDWTIDLDRVKCIFNMNNANFGVCYGSEDSDNIIEFNYKYTRAYLKQGLHESDFKNDKNLLLSEKYFRDNLFFINIMLHEIEHAKDFINNIDGKNDLRTNLFRLDLNYKEYIGFNNNISHLYEYYFGDRRTIFSDLIYYTHCKKERKLYDSLYSISFAERVADIGAAKNKISLIESIKDEIKRVYELEKDFLFDLRMGNYHTDETSPTIEYFKKLGLSSVFNRFIPDNLDLETRIDYGLKLTKKELETSSKHYDDLF